MKKKIKALFIDTNELQNKHIHTQEEKFNRKTWSGNIWQIIDLQDGEQTVLQPEKMTLSSGNCQ